MLRMLTNMGYVADETRGRLWWIGPPLLLFIYIILKAISNALFSPLADFPGPKTWALSYLPSQYSILTGRHHLKMLALHNTYGSVIRVGPNELSFNTAAAFHDIYAFDSSRRQLAKDEKLYGADTNGVRDSVAGFVDDANHGRQRRLVAHAFSDRALLDQEEIIVWHINYFVKRLKEERVNEDASCPNSGSIDMKTWFNYLTFDITGDLVFAETFGCLKNNELHPWVAVIFNTLKGIAFLSVMDHFLVLRVIKKYLLPTILSNSMREHFRYSSDRADTRIAMGANRKDIMGYILKNGLSDEKGVHQENDNIMSRHEIHANAFFETTATLLSGCIYYLCQTPSAMRRLVDEIRHAFPSSEAINARECAKLDYLVAVIKESLRLYPPLASNLPRISPPEGIVVDGSFVPPGVTISTHHYASYHGAANFTRPREFCPERWLKGFGEFAADDKDAVQPFSLGPRNCLGKNLAYIEIRLILAKLLFHFDLEICAQSKTWIDHRVFIVWEKKPLMVRLTNRVVGS